MGLQEDLNHSSYLGLAQTDPNYAIVTEIVGSAIVSIGYISKQSQKT